MGDWAGLVRGRATGPPRLARASRRYRLPVASPSKGAKARICRIETRPSTGRDVQIRYPNFHFLAGHVARKVHVPLRTEPSIKCVAPSV